ncbi:MAG: 16S rRNA (uracil(1498)-N(3))-methyltransferase [Cyclobacteriaceae bacterium]|nr:16S rRNA (uracil(1498)-N(3))-methyltransferase [Cyclobacteriaceae bacterium]
MELYFAPEINEQTPVLPEEEARHAIKVLRKALGDRIHITDGKGHIYSAEIADVNIRNCRLDIIGSHFESPDLFYTHIAIAPTKNIDRISWFVEKSVELGIHEISFIGCRNSERTQVKADRIMAKVISAVKQSVKPWLPKVNEMVSFNDFLQRAGEYQDFQKFICHLRETAIHLQHQALPNRKYLVMVGPEGDFCDRELDLAETHGFLSATLGKSRLRTETAGIAACHILQLANQL